MSTNLCNTIDCPFSDPKNGCQRYSVSSHCHLVKDSERGEKFYEHRVTYPVATTLTDNQYWLFLTEELREENIKKFKRCNDQWIKLDPFYQKQLEVKKMLGLP